MVKYIDIADDIRSKIFDKKYTYGQKLPYEYVLCVAYHCNKETMKKALDILVKEGLIVKKKRSRNFCKRIMMLLQKMQLNLNNQDWV